MIIINNGRNYGGNTFYSFLPVYRGKHAGAVAPTKDITVSCGCTFRHWCPKSQILLKKRTLHILDCLTPSTGARTSAFHFYLFTTGNLQYKNTGWKPGSSEVKDKILIDFCRQRTLLLCFWLYFSVPGLGLKGQLKRLCYPQWWWIPVALPNTARVCKKHLFLSWRAHSLWRKPESRESTVKAACAQSLSLYGEKGKGVWQRCCLASTSTQSSCDEACSHLFCKKWLCPNSPGFDGSFSAKPFPQWCELPCARCCSTIAALICAAESGFATSLEKWKELFWIML